MLKRLTLVLLVYLCVSGTAEARERYFNYCQRGGQKVVTQGLQSAGTYQRTFQSCTLHVYLAGTTTLATLYSDNLTPVSTPLANPFTAASDGFFYFYAAAGKYDVQETFLDGTVSPPVTIQLTWGDVLLCDPIGPNADSTCTLPPPEACTSVQVNGVEAGCEHEINFHGQDNITVTAVDDPANSRTNVTIAGCPSCGGAAAAYDLEFSSLPLCPPSQTCGTLAGANEAAEYAGSTYGLAYLDQQYSIRTCHNMNGTEPDTQMPICYIRYSTSASAGNTSFLCGPNEHILGNAKFYQEKYDRLSSITQIDVWLGMTSNPCHQDWYVSGPVNDPTSFTADNILFRYSSGTGGAGDTHWMCALQQNSGTLTLIDSGVTPDVYPHKYRVESDGTTATWKIDGTSVCSHAVAFTDGYPLVWMNMESTLDANAKSFDFGYAKGGVVFPTGP
jgi:hypothetical protein